GAAGRRTCRADTGSLILRSPADGNVAREQALVVTSSPVGGNRILWRRLNRLVVVHRWRLIGRLLGSLQFPQGLSLHRPQAVLVVANPVGIRRLRDHSGRRSSCLWLG